MSGSPSTALLVIDGINDFYDPQGTNYYPEVQSTVEPIRALLERAREHDAVTVHAVERHRAGLDDYEWRVLPEHAFSGTFGSEIFASFTPAQRPRELELHKRRFSAFFATDLALTLREQGVESVVIAGVKTNVCIRATAQDALAYGFGVVVPREATNSNRPHLADASLEDIARYIGRVVALEEALALL